jgi:hypothetical protein
MEEITNSVVNEEKNSIAAGRNFDLTSFARA